ncbi:hypothetical protein X727_09475 [Mesorhizobium sp. L103C119B0]|nr:hypothetical protein X770_20950 [Mesorhizobium sp. LSJC269B00]ESX12979.1 hypothetical protein X767_30570 [Mesorhizobium sp. LSJC264A00]ESX14062.1 hypothetical protein X768_03155 [Mesorhizobium sp. LSJC265A00]ESX92335.1 hypothetical protein X754_20395 [Mesorhizobium sp. LNJC403B00]ESZ71593.1 hypothetical protein X727_09475 [Mesorhizobium sp. L103C119B0]
MAIAAGAGIDPVTASCPAKTGTDRLRATP